MVGNFGRASFGLAKLVARAQRTLALGEPEVEELLLLWIRYETPDALIGLDAMDLLQRVRDLFERRLRRHQSARPSCSLLR